MVIASTPDSDLKTWENPHQADIDDLHRADRWPFSSMVRDAIVGVTLKQVGLDIDGTPLKLPDGSLAPKLPSRERVAAIKLLTTLDKNMLDAKRFYLASGCEPYDAEKAQDDLFKSLINAPDVYPEAISIFNENRLPPITSAVERVKKEDRERAEALLNEHWPISYEARLGVISATLEICGFAVGDNGEILPTLEIEHQPCSRTRMAALRLFGIFDRLSMQFRRVDKRIKEFCAKKNQLGEKTLTPEGSEKAYALLNAACIRKHGVKLPPVKLL